MHNVYTDGACSGGFGGWAWAIDDWRYDSGAVAGTTNQRMELQAALEAIRFFPRPITVFSDSAYLVNCFHYAWFEGWQARDWHGSNRKPVANRDIWEPLIELALQRKAQFVKVKGHSGNAGNDLVDRLAVEARLRLRSST